MISAARLREPGKRVATTATRSFVPGSVPRVRFPPSSRATTAPMSLRGERRPVSTEVGKALARRRAARIVLDDWLGFRLLVHDDEPVSSLNDFFEFWGLVSED